MVTAEQIVKEQPEVVGMFVVMYEPAEGIHGMFVAKPGTAEVVTMAEQLASEANCTLDDGCSCRFHNKMSYYTAFEDRNTAGQVVARMNKTK